MTRLGLRAARIERIAPHDPNSTNQMHCSVRRNFASGLSILFSQHDSPVLLGFRDYLLLPMHAWLIVQTMWRLTVEIASLCAT